MKVALTLWEGRVSPVFDVCRKAVILGIEEGNVVSRVIEDVCTTDASLKVRRFLGLGIDTLICGAISAPLRRELTERGVNVLGFVAGDADEVEQAFLAGALPNPMLSMPGYCHERRRFGGVDEGCCGQRRRRPQGA